jgi:hypothetical protein
VHGLDNPPAQVPDVQDLITSLLHTAIQAGGTLERLDRFATLCPEDGLTAAADLAVTVQLMSGVRAALIHCADELAAGRHQVSRIRLTVAAFTVSTAWILRPVVAESRAGGAARHT